MRARSVRPSRLCATSTSAPTASCCCVRAAPLLMSTRTTVRRASPPSSRPPRSSSLGRCDQCTECPLCQHSLQTAFHSSGAQYSLFCANCRWSSIDRSNPDSAALAVRRRRHSAAVTGASAREQRGGQDGVPATDSALQVTAQAEPVGETAGEGETAAARWCRHHGRAAPRCHRPLPRPPVTSSSMYQSLLAASRSSAGGSGGVEHSSPLQRFLAVDEQVSRQRHDQYYHLKRQQSDSGRQTFSPLPGYMKGEFGRERQ